MSKLDIILDSSQQNLKEVPTKILNMSNLKMLYLQNNDIETLPLEFFTNLAQLTWLDLRNNRLISLPNSIANHGHLENLLLTNNKIEALPNELGLVPKLKVLQVANNPLMYPNSSIVSKGTKSICEYLKRQYEKILAPPSDGQNEAAPEKKSPENRAKKSSDEEVVTLIENFFQEYPVEPSLTVKGLSGKKKKDEKLIHKVSKDDPNKICIKSYYYDNDDNKYVKASTQTSDHLIARSKTELRQSWMEKLRLLLEQQEKILQQERNLHALGTWRYQQRSEPIKEVYEKGNLEAPYATYPEYNTMLSREDLSKQIDKFIQRSINPPKKGNVEKLINDLVMELKDMETAYDGVKSARSEIEEAGKQIMKIVGVHKKVLQLQGKNNLLFQ